MTDSTLFPDFPRPTYTCEQCGESFEKHWAGTATRRFCSVTCRNRHIAQRPREILGKVCPQCGHYGRDRQDDLCHTCGGAFWTSEQITYLRKHYPEEGCEGVALALGKTPLQVRQKANLLHVSLTKAARKRIIYDISSERMTKSNPMKQPEVQAKVRAWGEAHPEVRARIQDALMEGHRRLERDKPSKLEIKLRAFLTDFGVRFEFSVLIKPRFIVDIRIGRFIIQADGDYWHGHPRFPKLTERQLAQQKRDQAQDTYLRACGYTVIRIWESDLTREHLKTVLRDHGIIPA